MPSLPRFIDNNWRRVANGAFRLRKSLYQYYKIRPRYRTKTILFILGCQRSGTTLLAEIFERDLNNSKVYHEFSRLSSYDKIHKIRLNPLHLVKKEIDQTRAALVVLKPLVESQNALTLLDYFDNSRVLWVYRHYRDVAVSNLRIWGIQNGINNLRSIVENQPHNWRSEKVSEHTRNIVVKFFSEYMNPYDAAALFWMARNRLFFELNLDKNENVMTCKYDDLIDTPIKTMSNIYRWLGFKYPAGKIDLHIYSDSKGRGKDVGLSKEIDLLCDELLEKLESTHGLKKSNCTAKE